ncbi:MAG: GNAT family N-acetyltransferase [Alphaproteobacteria bacterium]|nr:GNAT family N-acetyltransferase [Alphaproteobacteria bacterium]
MKGVTLKTDRLILRPWISEDRAAFAAMNADSEVRRFFPSRQSRAESDASADFLTGQFERTPFGPWAVEIPGIVAFAGFVGLWETNLDVPPRGRVEIGWRLARGCWGKGYATEAARAALAFGFHEAGLEEIVAFVVPANRASRGVMDRVGLREVPGGAFDHPRVPEGHPLRRHLLYRLTRADWHDAPPKPYSVQG